MKKGIYLQLLFHRRTYTLKHKYVEYLRYFGSNTVDLL